MPRRRGSYFAHFAEEGKELKTQFERSLRSDGSPAVIVGPRLPKPHSLVLLRHYFAPVESAAVSRPEFGYYGWGTWVGQWQRE
jgi:hypothetical protein